MPFKYANKEDLIRGYCSLLLFGCHFSASSKCRC